MLHDLFTVEVNGKKSGGLNNFEHNCTWMNNNRYILILLNSNITKILWSTQVLIDPPMQVLICIRYL